MRAVKGKAVKAKRRRTVGARHDVGSAAGASAPRVPQRLRAQIDGLQRRLAALEGDAGGDARELLGDAARFLGAALARLQQVGEVLAQAPAIHGKHTGHRRRRETARSTKDVLADVAAHIPGLIYSVRISRTGRATLVYLSEGPLASTLGLRIDEVRANPAVALSVLTPDGRELVQRALGTAGGETRRFELPVQAADGQRRWLRVEATPRPGEDGAMLWQGMVTDVTDQKAIEDALHESEALFANAFQHAMTGIAIVALDGRPLRVNGVLCEMLGYSEQELCRGTVLDVTHGDDVAETAAQIRRLTTGEIPSYRMEKRYVRKDGGIIWATLSVSLVRNSIGEPLYLIGQVDDITERKRAIAALYESEQRFQSAFDHAPIGMVLALPDGQPLRVNRAFCDMVGYDAVELLAMRPHQIAHPDDIVRAQARHARTLAGEGSGDSVDLRYRHRDGHIVWGRAAGTLVRDAEGEPSHMIVQIEDITERKRIEQALLENESKFRTLAESAAALIFIIQGSRFRYVNAAAEALTGYNRAELQNGEWTRIVTPAYRDLARARGEARQAGAILPSRDEVEILGRSGETYWVEFTAAPIVYAGKPAILGTAFDITERRRVSQALRESDERFALAVEAAHDGIWDWHFGTPELYVSPRLWAILGFAEGEREATPASLLALVHPDDRRRIADEMQAHASGDTPHFAAEFRIRHRDGTYRWALARGLAVHGRDGLFRRMAGSLSDITARKEAEQRLRDSEEQFRALAETVAAATFIFQGESLRYVNSSAEAMTGYSRAELLAMSFWDVIHPDFQAFVRERGMARQRGEGPPAQYEVKICTKAGDERWVQFSAGMIMFNRQVAVLGTAFDITDRKRSEEALRASEVKNKAILDASPDTFVRIRGDGIILDVKGDTSSWRTPAADAVGRNLGDLVPAEIATGALTAIGRAIGLGRMDTYDFETETAHGLLSLEARIVPCGGDEALCSIRDITARRRAEREARQRQSELAHVARLSTMGEMAAALAHELNQPLMAIVGFASGCVLRVESGALDAPELLGALRSVSQQAVRAGEVIRRIRDFVRKARPQRELVNLNDLVREVVGLADVEARAHAVTLRLELGDIPHVIADRIQIEQVMLNLIRNGIEAMVESSGPRVLTVRTSTAIDATVDVAVIDRGKGLPIGIDDPFEPFVSTKATGLGLGLSISRSIVEAHGGRVTAWSDDTPSTTFRFTLPVAR